MLQGLFVSGCSLKSNLHYQTLWRWSFFILNACQVQVKDTHACVHTQRKLFLWSSVINSLSMLSIGKKNKRASLTTPFQARPSDLCLWGLNLWTQALHTHTQSPTYTLHHHTMPQHLFLSCKYKTTLTGALSALVELSRWNVYLYIQMAWCHVVSHNVSWTNNVSHFSIRPAALKPPF